MEGLLVTLGCSWVKGVGAHYEEGISKDEYIDLKMSEEHIGPYAFRTLLAERNNLELVSFGAGASSNKRQFRCATKFFSGPEFEEYQDKYSTIIVLWGLTSTARDEQWDIENKKWRSFLYGVDYKLRGSKFEDYHNYSELMLRRFYDHDVEVNLLSDQMKHWNEFFKCKGVKNMWFDILNHHDYKYKFDNLMMDDGDPRDLLSRITTHKTKDKFHLSIWDSDCSRIEKGVFTKTLNPYSNHPTKKGHEKIFSLLDPYVKNLLRDS